MRTRITGRRLYWWVIRIEPLVALDRKASRMEHFPVKMSNQQALVPHFNVSRRVSAARHWVLRGVSYGLSHKR
jgi:hypothetical protein